MSIATFTNSHQVSHKPIVTWLITFRIYNQGKKKQHVSLIYVCTLVQLWIHAYVCLYYNFGFQTTKCLSQCLHSQIVKNGTKYFFQFVHQTSCNTIKNVQHSLWNIHKNKMGYESNEHKINHYVMHYNYSLFKYAIYLNICCQYYKMRWYNFIM